MALQRLKPFFALANRERLRILDTHKQVLSFLRHYNNADSNRARQRPPSYFVYADEILCHCFYYSTRAILKNEFENTLGETNEKIH